MILIHPHWQSTDDTAPLPSLKKEGVHIRIGQAPGSRRPAAILGVSLVLLLALFLLQNVRTLAGQLTESSSTIRITQSGLEPGSITVLPGAVITWKNEDTKPHILSSDTLRTKEGLLYSTAIFPEEEFRATISEEGAPGEYSYVSLTDSAIAGTVHIGEGNTTPPPSSSSPPPPSPPLIPKNPLVAEARPTGQHNVPPAMPHSRSSSPKPFRHPETGIPLGISVLTSVVVLLFFTRRILRSLHAQVIRP